MLCMQARESFSAQQEKLDLKLYITSDHLAFFAIGGFLRAQSYRIFPQSGYILFSDNDELQKENMGIYNSKGMLYLNFDKDLRGKQDLKLGDTIIPFLAISDSNPNILIYNPKEFTEKPVTVTEYLSVVLVNLKKRFHDCSDFNRLEMIINPKMKSITLINKIDSLAGCLGYKTTQSRKDFKEGNERIKRKLEDLESAKAFGSGCCMDDSTANIILESISKKGRAKK
jgi:hypothetical protein